MKIKKGLWAGCLMMLAATLVVLPGVANSAMWVGAQGGVNLIGNADIKGSDPWGNTLTVHKAKFDNPQALGGLTIGYDFVKTGFLGSNCWPEWMKYFSFALDFTYNTFQIRSQDVGISISSPEGTFSFTDRINRVEGTVAALTFLFMAKYGFYCDSTSPFGRIVPYLGVGPAVVWSSMRTDQSAFGVGSGSLHSDSTDVALVAEAGIRWVCLSNVSIDTAFRYRWFEPKFNFPSAVGTSSAKVNIDSYTALLRVNYHF